MHAIHYALDSSCTTITITSSSSSNISKSNSISSRMSSTSTIKIYEANVKYSCCSGIS